MSTILVCQAVSASLDNTIFMGKVTCKEKQTNGRIKTLWHKRVGRKLLRTTKKDALEDAVIFANDIMNTNYAISYKLLILK